MLKQMFKFGFMVLISAILISGYSFAQVSGVPSKDIKKTTAKSMYPVFTISPVAGIIFPMSELGNNYQAGFNGGLDAGVRLNKELGLYAKTGYYSLTDVVEGAPNSSYIEVSAGPRYYFSSKNLKSTFFLEAGVGAYIFSQDAYETETGSIDRKSNTNAGVNVGPGVTLQLSKSIDVILKSKYHLIFNDAGTRSFLTALGGLEFKF